MGHLESERRNTEFIVVPNEDKTRVDVALFLTPFAPAVFIEIKGVGLIQGRLADIERQLRDYNRNNTAMFTIITDGREWRFYFSQTGGEFSKNVLRLLISPKITLMTLRIARNVFEKI